MSRNLYDILRIAKDASEDDIRSAYRKLARMYHPDVNKEKGAEKRFTEVQNAYEVLSDKRKRRNYDRYGDPEGRPRPTAPAGPPSGPSMSDVMDQFFGGMGGMGGGGGTGAATRSRRGKDLEYTLAVSFMSAAVGGVEHVRMARADEIEVIEVKIPVGVKQGDKLRLKGRGGSGVGGAGRGDLIITVDIGEHPHFKRDGYDLLVDVPLTVVEAMLGATVDVPLLKGTISLKIPPSTSSGKKLRIKGKGISTPKNTGDLYVIVQIQTQPDLSDKARELLEALGPELKNPRESGR